MLCEKIISLLLVAYLASAVFAIDASNNNGMNRALRKRYAASTDPKSLDGQTFDYVVIGGGLAGLVVASRLSENKNINVAVIEAGSAGTSKGEKARIDPPAGNLYNHVLDSELNWNFTTVPQVFLGTNSLPWPRGKVLGGGSAVNGLYYVRHSRVEQDAWGDLINDKDHWGWDNMYRAMKKAENFTDATDDVKKLVHIESNSDSHGNKGPIQVSWPGQAYEACGAFVNTSSDNFSPFAQDAYSGFNIGTYAAMSTINPSNWTRSFARSGYYDPYVYRENLHVLTEHLVTKIDMDNSGKLAKATAVHYKAKPNGKEYTVKVGREAIVSGGAVNTPQILQLSGIGEKSFLESKQIGVVVDSPGVGYNLQDHLSGGVEWSPASKTQMPPSDTDQSDLVNSYTNGPVAYVNGTQIMGNDDWGKYLDQVKGNKSNAVNALQAPDVVKQGYDLTYSTVAGLLEKNVAPLEMLFSMAFGKLQVQTAMQHEFSRGTIMINSTDPFEYPIIDPRYLEQDTDKQMIRAGFKLARKIGQTDPLKSYFADETNPGSNVNSDDQWDQFIAGRVGTEYHPSGTAAMLPKNKGGVVDKKMRVYGTSNLRVIDASVVPFVMSSHFMSLVYGLAEIGAELVLDDYNNSNNGGGAGAGGNKGNGSSNDNKSATTGGSADSHNGATGLSTAHPGLVFTLAVSALLGLISILSI